MLRVSQAHIACSSTTTRAAIACAFPIVPIPSPDFAFKTHAIDRQHPVIDAISLTHRIDVRGHLGAFGKDHAVQIDDVHAVMADALDRLVHEIAAVTVAVVRIIVREQSPDVGFGDRSQQRIGDGVQQDIGIAVADRVDLARDIDAADSQRPTISQSVRVIAESNAYAGEGLVHVISPFAQWRVDDRNLQYRLRSTREPGSRCRSSKSAN